MNRQDDDYDGGVYCIFETVFLFFSLPLRLGSFLERNREFSVLPYPPVVVSATRQKCSGVKSAKLVLCIKPLGLIVGGEICFCFP